MSGLSVLLGVGGICMSGVGYLLHRSAEDKCLEAKEMRQTSTTPVNALFRQLRERSSKAQGALFAEIHGKTFAPCAQMVRTQKNEPAVAIKKSTFECVEECEWVERMARKTMRSGPNGPARSVMVGTGIGDWKCSKAERHITTSSKGSTLHIFYQAAYVDHVRRGIAPEVGENQDPPLDYIVEVREGGLGGGNAFFELSSESYRPNEATNINVNVNTASSEKPIDTHRTRILGWFDREYYVAMNRDVYALGEVSLSAMQSTSALIRDQKKMLLSRPMNPEHHFICEPGTEPEIYARKMSAAGSTRNAAYAFYGLAGVCLVASGVVAVKTP